MHYTISRQRVRVFDAAGYDGVNVGEAAFLDISAQLRAKILVRLYAVDFCYFGSGKAGELVSGTRADFEDGTVSFGVKGGEDGVVFVSEDCVIWEFVNW